MNNTDRIFSDGIREVNFEGGDFINFSFPLNDFSTVGRISSSSSIQRHRTLVGRQLVLGDWGRGT